MKSVSLFTHNRYDPVTECWNWTGFKSKNGYGWLQYGGKHEGAHRVAMHVWRGFDLSSGLCVLHKCDNRACVNPQHLFVGTKKDNMRDCISKGRVWRNPRNTSKTHCKRGHPYSGDNLYVSPVGKRQCKECYKTVYADQRRLSGTVRCSEHTRRQAFLRRR